MIEANRLPFDEYLDNPEDDIEFIKELMTGKKGPQAVCYYFHLLTLFSLGIT